MLKFALIGCGQIAKRHSALLGERQIKGAELVAVCDKNLERAHTIGQKYNVPSYSDMHEMMEKEDIEVVVILTGSGLHAAHTILIAQYGVDIVVEKPMALSLEDADAMIHACDTHGVELFVVKQNRFNVPVLTAREALEAGRFGKLVLGTVRVRWCRQQSYYDQETWRGTWAMDGGVLANQAIHHIDLLQWMMGEVESVFAFSSTALADIETEDTAVVTLKFKNGALGIIEATTATRPKDLEGSISILGEKGSVEIGGFAANEMKVWNFSNPVAQDKYVFKKYSVNPPNDYGFAHQAFYEQVVDCLKNKNNSFLDGLEGKKSLKLIHAIYKSIENGKVIIVDSLLESSKLGQR